MRRPTLIRLARATQPCCHFTMPWVRGTYGVERCPLCGGLKIAGFPPGAAAFNW